MTLKEDNELERIKAMKLREMLQSPGPRKTRINKPLDISDLTFHDVVNRFPLIVIDCWAPWCAPCRMIAPIIVALAQEYAGRVVFGKLNVDDNRKIAMQYSIASIPTLLLFKNGRMMDRIIGAIPKQALEQRITRYLE